MVQANTRIWQTYYVPKPLSELYSGWQEMLAEHRQTVVEVREIEEETGWRGPAHGIELYEVCQALKPYHQNKEQSFNYDF